MSKRPILKTDNPLGIPYSYELIDYVYKIGSTFRDLENSTIRVKFKPGKRWKLKALRIKELAYHTMCECCGPQLCISVRIGGKDHSICGHY